MRAGTWRRLEGQGRWRKDREATVDDVISRGIPEQFVGGELRAVVAGDHAVTMCDPNAAATSGGALRGHGATSSRELASAKLRPADVTEGIHDVQPGHVRC